MALEEKGKCQLLGSFGIIVQLILGFFTLLILVIKRQLERPRRLWKIFLMDTSKQIASALLTHLLNVGLAIILSSNQEDDACIWYFITYMCDCTIGVFFSYVILTLFEKLFEKKGQQQFKTGNYYRILYPKQTEQEEVGQTQKKIKPKVEVDCSVYIFQLILWNFIVCISKTILYFFQLVLASQLQQMADFIFSPIKNEPEIELLIIMVLIPIIMNGISFWIQDNFLKKNGIHKNEKDLVMGVLYEKGSDDNPPGNIVQRVELEHFQNAQQNPIQQDRNQGQQMNQSNDKFPPNNEYEEKQFAM